MSNLIPETLHKKIRSEYRARFILAGSLMAAGTAFFAALALSPGFGVLFITRPPAAAQTSLAEAGKQEGLDITLARALITQLEPVAAASSSVSSAIISALEKRPSGVRVDSIDYLATASGPTMSVHTITMEGMAEARDQIDKYRAALQADPRFTSVRLPVDDLLGKKGSRFTITLTGNF
jgi:hypothetical protein